MRTRAALRAGLAAAVVALAPAGCTRPRADPLGRGPVVSVTFSVDDRANQVFDPGDLGLVWLPAAPGAPGQELYDDGPVSEGGHEGDSAASGDHIFGFTVRARPLPSLQYTFSFVDRSVSPPADLGPGPGGGLLVVWRGQPEPLGTTLVLPPFGSSDLGLVVDTTRLAPGPRAWDTSRVEVKGSAWSWLPVEARDDGLQGDAAPLDRRHTFLLSGAVGPGSRAPHQGLRSPGDEVRFVVLLGGEEYRSGPDGGALTAGVSAFVTASGGKPTAVPVGLSGGAASVLIP